MRDDIHDRAQQRPHPEGCFDGVDDAGDEKDELLELIEEIRHAYEPHQAQQVADGAEVLLVRLLVRVVLVEKIRLPLSICASRTRNRDCWALPPAALALSLEPKIKGVELLPGR